MPSQAAPPPPPPVFQFERNIRLTSPFAPPPIQGATALNLANVNTYRLPTDARTAEWVPPSNPNWLVTAAMHELIVALDSNFNVLLVGDQGVGKTDLVRQTCAERNYPCTRIMMSEGVRESDLFGRWSARNGEMVWLPGPVQRAVEDGHVLLIDEIDFADPGHLVAMRGLLETKNRLLLLNGKDGSVVRPHPQFRVCAAANSIGSINRLNFIGARDMNHADLDRFGWTISLRHMEFDPENNNIPEVDIIMRTLRSSVASGWVMKVGEVTVSWDQIKSTVTRMVKVATLVRGANRAGQIMFSFGLRATLQWAHNYLLYGNAGIGLTSAVLHKLSPDEFKVIEEIQIAEFGSA